jgi:hypothetical protein
MQAISIQVPVLVVEVVERVKLAGGPVGTSEIEDKK